jgi:hypothetical protein
MRTFYAILHCVSLRAEGEAISGGPGVPGIATSSRKYSGFLAMTIIKASCKKCHAEFIFRLDSPRRLAEESGFA